MVFEPNVRGVFNSMKYEAEVMLKQGFGSIINNASMGARSASKTRHSISARTMP
jgi:NADP-dependent 3-hydroxy acid dehydrogenase YdfG